MCDIIIKYEGGKKQDLIDLCALRDSELCGECGECDGFNREEGLKEKIYQKTEK